MCVCVFWPQWKQRCLCPGYEESQSRGGRNHNRGRRGQVRDGRDHAGTRPSPNCCHPVAEVDSLSLRDAEPGTEVVRSL